jgi:hypothetical protein
MIVVRGAASRVTQSQEIVRGIDDIAVGQVMSCQIDGRDVHLSMPTVPNIRNGDEVVVAGWMKQGTLHGRAYRNLDTGSCSRWSYQATGLFVTVPIVTGFALFFFAAVAPPLLPLSLLPGAWQWWNAFRTYRAYRAVLAESRTPADRGDRMPADTDDDDEEALPIEPARQAPPANASFPCPRCGKRLKVSRQAVGKRVRCPSRTCGAVIDTGRSAG